MPLICLLYTPDLKSGGYSYFFMKKLIGALSSAVGDAYASPSHLKKSLNICLQRNQSIKSLDKTMFCSLEGMNTY